jgi:hypothetical protein
MVALLVIWVIGIVLITFFDGWFIWIDVDRMRRNTPTKEERKTLRNETIVFLLAWAWPLLIFVVIGRLLWKSGSFVKDWYLLSFGREAEDKVLNYTHGRPTGTELKRQQEMSRKANAERAARKEERRKQYEGVYG